MRSITALLADLIAEAAMDQDAGLEEWGAGTRRIYDEIIRRFEEAQRGHQDRPAHAEMRAVPGRQDPAGEVGSTDLPRL
jgi:hypothetical protein